MSLKEDVAFVRAGLRVKARIRGLKADAPLNLADALEASVDRFADRIAIRFEEETLTYAAFDARANRYARWALERGFGPGDVVALFMENRPDYLCVWYGLAKVGVATALVNSQLGGRSLAHCVGVAAARAAIVDGPLWPAFAEARSLLETPVEAWVSGGSGEGARDLDAALSGLSEARPDRRLRAGTRGRDLALYIYTSGTTGLPKAARITHLRMLQTMHCFAAAVDAGPEDVIYAPLPLYHTVGGVCAPGIALTTGGAVALRKSFSVSAFWPDVVRHRATLFQYIGELCRYLVNAPEHPDEARHRLRLVIGNGMRPDVWDRFQSRFRVPTVLEFYAATESNLTLFNFAGRPHAIGRAPPWMGKTVNLEIVRFDADAERPVRDARGRCVRCAPDEAGEAIAQIDPRKADKRFEGYSDGAATDAKILRDVFRPGDAWFRSGDLMRKDREGYVYFVDRVGDTFRWKSENVSTAEVAQALSAAPGVREVCVYGVAVPGQDGRAGMAAVVADDGFDPAAVFDLARRELPSYARPLFLRRVESLQATGTFKHKKAELVADGFDPGRIADPLWFDDPRAGARPLDAALAAEIASGAVRL